ncbi:unnamed protein product [Notodromas monacha]|uniref:Coiled-coil domain-containing protein 93 n=1 Tax=Notodromas monacha TaxID=399045 RepID=A0A7R9BW30_9CRUS|nr:unnamed protein product [Notodromas monacha]CAG0921640.1 unnamed protein product [Notodromas monacha]
MSSTEQEQVLSDVFSLLVAAGYFRARIRGLSPFDKILGGLTWCFEAAAVDVDVDLFYDADALSIGQKIALTEKLVHALQRVRCPHIIQPHQIQGLDAPAIFPVAQWLVKKALETRNERREETLARGSYEFQRTFGKFLESLDDEEISAFTGKRLTEVQKMYAPSRVYRRTIPLPSDAEEAERVRSTLLEFGRTSVDINSEDPSSDLYSKEILPMEQKITRDDVKLSEDTRNLLQAQVQKFSVPAVNVIITPEKLKAVLDAHHAALETSISRKTELKAKMAVLKGEYHETSAEISKCNDELLAISQVVDKPENKAMLEKLQELVEEHDSITKKENKLKAVMEQETLKLEAELEAYSTVNSAGDKETSREEEKLIQEDIDAATSQVDDLRLQNAEVSKRLLDLSRKGDSIPMRAELVQYQRRFVELYAQVASKHRETKQYYTLYNSLEDQKSYLDRAVTLMNSIVETFPRAFSGTDAAKEEFIGQLDTILFGIRASQAKLDQRQRNLEQERENLRKQRRELADAHRAYLKTVKSFQEECKRNEKLITALTNWASIMVLYVVGLGLGDCADITVKGLERVKAADAVYFECYTSILGLEKEALEAFYGRSVFEADRTLVEEGSDVILDAAERGSVAFLVVGDPLSATTHTDLILRAKERSIQVEIIHNASIMTAVASCGLQLYSFGETVSIPFWTESWKPDSFFDKILANHERNLHTLCLLDIKVKERSVENMMRGKNVFEPPRFMTAAQGAQQLVEIIAARAITANLPSDNKPKINPDSLAIALCRMGKDSQLIVACGLKEMCLRDDLGGPLHSLVIPGPKLHEVELEFVKQFFSESKRVGSG